jgi:hypothetical protein
MFYSICPKKQTFNKFLPKKNKFLRKFSNHYFRKLDIFVNGMLAQIISFFKLEIIN